MSNSNIPRGGKINDAREESGEEGCDDWHFRSLLNVLRRKFNELQTYSQFPFAPLFMLFHDCLEALGFDKTSCAFSNHLLICLMCSFVASALSPATLVH